ncbi:MAG: hypothetical protein V1929_06105 [bacterium]
MTTGEMMGWAGGIIGTIGGIAGGVIGSYFSIKNTNGPAEKRFMIHCAVGFSIFVISFLIILFLTPMKYWWIAWIPYVPILWILISKLNAKQEQIRKAEKDAQRLEATRSSH